MSNQSSQSTQTRPARSKAAPTTRRSPARKTGAAPTTPTPAPKKVPAARAARDLEAQRALLADPATIATGARPPAPRRATAPAAEARTAPTPSPSSKPKPRRAPAHPSASPNPSTVAAPETPAAEHAPAIATPAAERNAALDAPAAARAETPPKPARPIARTALLDATRAQRLAREARLRERDSREALARAREALEGPPTGSTHRRSPPSMPAPTPRAPTGSRWERHPLAPTPPTTASAASAPLANEPLALRTPPAPTVPLRPAIPAAERALAAELREARATLAIARETTQIQRDALARLRCALAQAASAPAPAPIEEPTALLEKITRLSARVQELELDLAHRERERAQLIESLAASEREQAERTRRLAALQDRYDVQEQALEQARRQAELERHRHTEAQATLDRLRAALRGIEGPATTGPETVAGPATAEEPAASACAPANGAGSTASVRPPAATSPAATHGSTPGSVAPIAVPPIAADGTPSPTPTSGSHAAPGTTAVPPTVVVVHAGPGAVPAHERGLFRAPIFECWRESQIRRHFGPLGLETTGDLLREPLARRQRAGGPALPILLLGAGTAARARALRDDLARKGAPRFVLHVADPLSPGALELPLMSGLDEAPRSHPAPEDADELAGLLRTVSPAVIVACDFLTTQRVVEPWLEVLSGARDAGACIVLLEETGRGAVVPGEEIEAIGQRIWELLPERYTRDPVTETPVASFRESFARRVTPPRNGLLGALRSRFALELCAQFGFLAEAFVSGPIAGCFDAEAARDRRFLEQITDLDERRVEAGSTEALHLIARIDPLAPRA
ncbi:MAG: hypothetical protein U0900_13700 [Myxococcota bacterium]